MDRLGRIEQLASKRVDLTVQETIEMMAVRHVSVAREVQEKALEALRIEPIESFRDAMAALKASVEMERTARGEPAKRSEQTVEVVLKENFAKWLERPGERSGLIKVLDNDGQPQDLDLKKIPDVS